MSYEPTVWKDGDLVTSAKLNKIEQGIANGSGVLVVNLVRQEPGSLDKTWRQIHDAPFVIIKSSDDASVDYLGCKTIYNEGNTYGVVVNTDVEPITFQTSEEDGYPTLSVETT